MYDVVKKSVAITLTISVVIFTLTAVLAIWDVFQKDVVGKSLSTLGVLIYCNCDS